MQILTQKAQSNTRREEGKAHGRVEVAEEAETQQTRMLKAECAWLKEEVAAGQQKQEDLRAAAQALREELAAQQQQQQQLQQQQQQPHQVALCRLHSTLPLYPSTQPLTRRRVICRHALHARQRRRRRTGAQRAAARLGMRMQMRMPMPMRCWRR
jgi:hypothetical protein